jgi:hypothetical protein
MRVRVRLEDQRGALEQRVAVPCEVHGGLLGFEADEGQRRKEGRSQVFWTGE